VWGTLLLGSAREAIEGPLCAVLGPLRYDFQCPLWRKPEAKENPPGRWWVNKPCNWPKGINDHSGDYLASRDVVHEHKTCINKKRLGEDAENSINS
jgi:hypothetical protein